MRTKYKPWAKPYLDEHPSISLSKDAFLGMKDYYLEIGSGKGKFICDMASMYPDKTFVGIEKNVTVSGMCCKKIVESGLKNAFLYFDFIEKVIDEMKDNTVEGIFLNFSDPWPKERHTKRRLTNQNLMTKYYRVLKKDGHLYFKTDNEDLFNFTIESLRESPFKIINLNPKYDQLDEFDAITEYEENFREEKKNIYRLVLQK
ncbi:MAG: tRNA (guanosine(46)-N7)-methyltransferase TrmB [Coprobacillus sp.]|nr:tRNA (guanosine(46)-N7)-methyltransferase TrmB [Coprobacillus sp.]